MEATTNLFSLMRKASYNSTVVMIGDSCSVDPALAGWFQEVQLSELTF